MLRSVNVISEAAEDHIWGVNGCDPTCVYGKISVAGSVNCRLEWEHSRRISNTQDLIQSTVYMKRTNWDSFTWNITEVEINAMNNWLIKGI